MSTPTPVTPNFGLWTKRTGNEEPLPVVEITEETRQKMREAIAKAPPPLDFEREYETPNHPETLKMYLD